MSAEYSTEMKISATKKELKELLHFLKGYEDGFEYENGDEVSFESMFINKQYNVTLMTSVLTLRMIRNQIVN